MKYPQQRKFALQLFKDIPDLYEVIEVIEDDDNCWGEILSVAKKHRKKTLAVIQSVEIPSEWAYKWARYIGNRKIMIEKITDSEWAFYWAREIGDRKIMRDRVTESQWAYNWARDIGDRKIMRDRITNSKWISRINALLQT